MLGPLLDSWPAITMKVMPKTDTEQLSRKLLAAGLARSLSPQTYLALKGGLAALFIPVGLIMAVTGAMFPQRSAW